MKDKTKLALVGTIVALAVVVLIGLIYFVVARKRLVLSVLCLLSKSSTSVKWDESEI